MDIEIPVKIAVQELFDGFFIGEALLFYEISRVNDSIAGICPGVRGGVRRLVKQLPVSSLSERFATGDVRVRVLETEMGPRRRSQSWRYPVPMVFHAVVWKHGSGIWQGVVPVLKIAAAGRGRGELEERLERQIGSELHRRRIDLEGVARIQRVRNLHLREATVKGQVPDLATRVEARDRPDPKESELSKAGHELKGKRLAPAFEMDAIVSRIADILTESFASSILVVGPSGAGKTAAIHETVRRKKALGLSAVRFFEMGGAGIVAGQTGFGMWQERCRNLVKECQKQGAVLYLGGLMELMEVGRSECNFQGVAAFLRPYLQRGDLRVIVECTPQQLPLIERNDPQMLDLFRKVRVEAASPEKCRAILDQVGDGLQDRLKIGLDPKALDEIVRLHRRFATYSTMPGRPVRFLENLAYDIGKQHVAERDAARYFSRETGLPLFMIDDSAPLDLDAAETWFNGRVTGQQEAVAALVAHLALVKTALSRTGKPLFAMLFIGPTGVGKTELAKVLAEFLFGDPERMIRFDMSEYASPYSVQRLAGDGSGKEGLLTAKIREQPFSVLLLDELEKAHPLFFDLMLQVLGEGRLTDSGGRVADFSNSAIVMTSNLGAHLFQKGKPGFGDKGPDRGSLAQVEDEVRKFFRPELVNRIDRIVPFYPLETGTLVAIAQRMIEDIRQRDGIRFRNIDLEFEPDAVKYLAEAQYDPRYGARPLRRRIEREVLAPLSEKLNTAAPEKALTAKIAATDGDLSVSAVQSGVKKRSPSPFDLAAARSANRMIESIAELRRRMQKTLRCRKVRIFQGDLFRYRKLSQEADKRSKKGRFLTPRHENALARLPRMEDAARKMEDAWNAVKNEEDEIMRLFYAGAFEEKSRIAARADALAEAWKDVLMGLYALDFHPPNRLCMAFYGESRSELFLLCNAFRDIFEKAGCEAVAYKMTRSEKEKSGKKNELLEEPELFFREPEKAPPFAGILFEISGSNAHPAFIAENGLHRFQFNARKTDCRVHCVADSPEDYRIADPIFQERGERDPRRIYRFDEGILNDRQLGKKLHLALNSFSHDLKTAADLCVQERIGKMFE